MNVLYICCIYRYIPPDKSSFFKQYICDIFYELENQIAKYCKKGKVMIASKVMIVSKVMVVRDLNSRCSVF